MGRIAVLDETGKVLASDFSNIISAAIWCNFRGYAHPMLKHNRYHVRGAVTFASILEGN